MKGDGTIFQRADGKWCAELEATNGAEARRRSRRIRDTKAEAQAALKELRKRRESGTLTGRATLSAFLNGWLAHPRRVTTQRSYQQVIAQHVTPFLGKLTLDKLTVLRLQGWIDDLGRKGRTANTIRYARTVLRSALTEAQRLELIITNPARLVRVPAHTKRRPKHFTPMQLDALIRHSPPWLACYIYVSAVFALRRGEALGLQWDDCDWNAGILHLERQIIETGEVKGLKTDGSRREFQIQAGVWRALTAQRRRLELAFVGRDVPIWIWPTSSGSPTLPANLERSFRKARTAAGLEDFRLHDLRATAIGRIIASRPLKDAQEYAGHEQAITTMGYDRMTPDRQLLTARAMQQAIPEPSSE